MVKMLECYKEYTKQPLLAVRENNVRDSDPNGYPEASNPAGAFRAL